MTIAFRRENVNFKNTFLNDLFLIIVYFVAIGVFFSNKLYVLKYLFVLHGSKQTDDESLKRKSGKLMKKINFFQVNSIY